jgi:hypothetical protein
MDIMDRDSARNHDNDSYLYGQFRSRCAKIRRLAADGEQVHSLSGLLSTRFSSVGALRVRRYNTSDPGRKRGEAPAETPGKP